MRPSSMHNRKKPKLSKNSENHGDFFLNQLYLFYADHNSVPNFSHYENKLMKQLGLDAYKKLINNLMLKAIEEENTSLTEYLLKTNLIDFKETAISVRSSSYIFTLQNNIKVTIVQFLLKLSAMKLEYNLSTTLKIIKQFKEHNITSIFHPDSEGNSIFHYVRMIKNTMSMDRDSKSYFAIRQMFEAERLIMDLYNCNKTLSLIPHLDVSYFLGKLLLEKLKIENEIKFSPMLDIFARRRINLTKQNIKLIKKNIFLDKTGILFFDKKTSPLHAALPNEVVNCIAKVTANVFLK
jgi:hypothetical protein